ncbi:hypothetical protein BP6252_06182 [Coleophoma cylindrospora]|uniref:Uncharacterized protein n=1 Tax=Coleophoma cylindrospora TaxID=1849047 RepID=A0A3D8RM62_9HELO|nr:hypothetical protein BP6252_06182 [Coleophoma cylindrospora]
MSRRISRPSVNICQLCDFLITPHSTSRLHVRGSKTISSTPKAISASTLHTLSKRRIPAQVRQVAGRRLATLTTETQHDSQEPLYKTPSIANLENGLKDAKHACEELLQFDGVPSEQKILETFAVCERAIMGQQTLSLAEEPVNTGTLKDGTAASILLSLDETNLKGAQRQKPSKSIRRSVEDLSRLLHSVITHPPVYITPKVLEAYVNIQAHLGRPETLPEALALYANKPVPVEGTSPVRYSNQNPNKVANAVPIAVADRALQAAIHARNLGAAIDIVENTYTTTAFYRSKFIRKALIPSTAALLAPVAAYSVASKLAEYQTTMDSEMATNVAFVGIVAYMGFTGSIGVVALTTANDQMDRVTWTPGIPLRERWMREDERAAIDQIAGSWGFRESWRRGEEEGVEWDTLREWIGRKGMLLDRVELMEGME